MVTDTRTGVLLANAKHPDKQICVSLPFLDEDELNESLRKIGSSTESEDISYDSLLLGAGEEEDDHLDGFFVMDAWSDYLPKDLLKEDLFAANELCQRIEDLNSCDQDLLDALIAAGEFLTDAVEIVEDGSATFYPDRDLATLAEELADEGYFTDEYLLEHVDWESVGRDMSCGGGYEEVAGGVLYR